MEEQDTLYILWTTGDAMTARNMVFMYACNSLARGWWQRVHLIVWGAATGLLAGDEAVQADMRRFLELGGEVSVCRRCAENLDVVKAVEATNFEGKYQVYYVGEFFTGILKRGEKLISV